MPSLHNKMFFFLLSCLFPLNLMFISLWIYLSCICYIPTFEINWNVEANSRAIYVLVSVKINTCLTFIFARENLFPIITEIEYFLNMFYGREELCALYRPEFDDHHRHQIVINNKICIKFYIPKAKRTYFILS